MPVATALAIGGRVLTVSIAALLLSGCQATTDRSGRTIYATPSLGQVLGLHQQPVGASILPAQMGGSLTDQQVVRGRAVQVVAVPGGIRIVVDGRVLATDTMSMRVAIKGVYEGGGHSYAVFEENSGGTACPAQYQAVDLTGGAAILSPQFGSCSDIPRITVSGGALVVLDPGFRAARPARFVFRDGRLIR